MEPEKFYHDRITKFNGQLKSTKKSAQWVALFRGITFLLLAGALYLIFTADHVWIWLLLILVVIFLYLLKKHEHLKNRINYYSALIELNHAEIEALKYNFCGFPTGEEFNAADHPYLQDLDIFGNGSVFQYLNRTATLTGRQTLAEMFIKPLYDPPAIKQRQNAVQELVALPEWRQDMQALAYLHPEKEDKKQDLLHWVKHPQQILENKYFRSLLYIIPVTGFLLLLSTLLGIFPFIYFLFYLIVVPLGLTGIKIKEINRIQSLASDQYATLEKYAELLRLIEAHKWESPFLINLRSQLNSGESTASGEIQRLSKLISLLDQRLNIMAALFLNGFFLWDLNICQRIAKWQQQNRQYLPGWISAIGQMDALVSLATFAYNHPAFSWPVVQQGPLQIEANQLGHFLLSPQERVTNDIAINGHSQLIIITGANMAGKSTFLRTLALNMIMAQLGAPVCAKKFTITPVQVFTSMRMKDSLQKHESYFFAELKRLQQMIQRLLSGEKLFIILDEILKGTNSKDQHLGSIGLIKQLMQLNASGIIATHDLSLGKMAEQYPQNIRNMRFEIEIENGEMQFDYKLKPGTSQNLNASFLMKQMGIITE